MSPTAWAVMSITAATICLVSNYYAGRRERRIKDLCVEAAASMRASAEKNVKTSEQTIQSIQVASAAIQAEDVRLNARLDEIAATFDAVRFAGLTAEDVAEIRARVFKQLAELLARVEDLDKRVEAVKASVSGVWLHMNPDPM